jgi:ADP-ribosylglycohydrolase
MTSSRIARARGALLGFACGDALGTTVEFHNKAAAQRRKDDAWPRDLVGGGPFRLLPGQVTDDTELMLALARSILRCGRYDEDDAARAYLRWFESGPFDCGMATRAAFAGYIDDAVPAAAVVAARASEDTQANGSLMRVLPIGVLGAALARERVAQWAMADSRLSHPSLVTQWACATYAVTVADAIEHGLRGEELFERAWAFAEGSPMEETLVACHEGLPESDAWSQGWVRIAMQHAYCHLLREAQLESALVETVLCGGDTDTNAAVVGGLLGAVRGVDAIPARWREAVVGCRSPRPAEFQCGDLLEVADGLFAAGKGLRE